MSISFWTNLIRSASFLTHADLLKRYYVIQYIISMVTNQNHLYIHFFFQKDFYVSFGKMPFYTICKNYISSSVIFIVIFYIDQKYVCRRQISAKNTYIYVTLVI